MNIRVKLLKQARNNLEAFRMSSEPGICYAVHCAIDQVAGNPLSVRCAAWEIQDQIAKRLGLCHAYYHKWLVHHGHTTNEELETRAGLEKLRRSRLAWIDALIEEFSNER